MVATVLFACFTGPLPARAAGSDTAASKSDDAATSKSVRQTSRHGKRSAHQRSTDGKKAGNDSVDAGSVTSAGIPPSVANANAELTSADTAADDRANTGSARVNTMVAPDRIAETQQPADPRVVASDQLNDVDRALQQAAPAEPQQLAQQQQQPAPQQAAEQQQPAPVPPQAVAPVPPQTVAMASAKPAPVQMGGDSSTWDQTSLIGKIFIGFGALLTVASAARMFIA
ncbi:hypothetical protein JQ615_24105 [Bradyrhizobium jicamae]|uniref:Uncharacterized protein n=2 Tax=Bradyrhizobium jicamae TaxID=280332 RepID=A0ABS5FNX8_9BRAD|nr:hypothetical protein [Bradyrhizobium jicamae]MBR0934809.1 hypothetical protein [Bradyrhizobium jicamae]